MPAPYRAKTAYEDGAAYDAHRHGSFRHRLIRRKEDAALAEYISHLGADNMLLLDVACGTGNALRVACGMGAAAIGLDVSLGMLRSVPEKVGDAERGVALVVGDAEHLPFADAAFDCVSAFRLIAHLPPQVCDTVMRELARTTSDAVILTHNHSVCLEYAVRRLLGLFKSRSRRKAAHPAVTVGQMRAQLRRAGLRLESLRFVAPLWQEECIVLARKRP